MKQIAERVGWLVLSQLLVFFADLIKLFFFTNEEFLGHFTISYFFLCVTKHSNLTAKIGKRTKKSFIGSATGFCAHEIWRVKFENS